MLRSLGSDSTEPHSLLDRLTHAQAALPLPPRVLKRLALWVKAPERRCQQRTWLLSGISEVEQTFASRARLERYERRSPVHER